MTRIYGLLFLVVSFTASMAKASDSGSMSKSCSGQIPVCDNSQPRRCQNQNFYIYGYQYAYTYNGELRSENHNINVNGALSGEYALLGLAGDYVIYDGPSFKLALPWASNLSIYAKQKNSLDGPGIGSGWKVLCQ